MSTPVQTIGRGLEAHERAKNAPGTFRLSALANAPATIAAISELTVKASRARDRLHELRAASVDAVQKHREQITAEYAELGMVENENGHGRLDTLGATRRKKMIDSAVVKVRKELNAATSEEQEITGKSASANQKIKIGMMRAELETKLGKKLDTDGNVVEPEDDSVRYTGTVSISESNRRWFAENGTHGTGGEINAD